MPTRNEVSTPNDVSAQTSMQAYVLTAFDAPPSLMRVPVPRPADDEVLIRVEAAAINPVDQMVARGFFRSMQEHRLPAVFGRDVCGTVEAVGSNVTRFRVGDTVWGCIKREYIGDGTFAQYVTSPQDRFIAHKPEALSVVEAGVLGLSSVTALECLDALHLKPGQSVLVNGATGGVGGDAVQIAASWGCTVLATARPGAPTDYVRDLGAHAVLDWTSGDLAEAVLKAAPGGVDAIVDLVRWVPPGVGPYDKSLSRRSLTEFARRVLCPGGRLTSTTDCADQGLLGEIVGVNVHSTPTAAALERICALVDAGSLRSPVHASYPLDAIADAFEHQTRSTLGKVAVDMT